MNYIPQTLEDAYLVLRTRVSDCDLRNLASDVQKAIMIIRDNSIAETNKSLLKEGAKLYFLDYEESGSSYTIKKNLKDCYIVQSDLSSSKREQIIYKDVVDGYDMKAKFFSTKERAKEQYKIFKSYYNKVLEGR